MGKDDPTFSLSEELKSQNGAVPRNSKVGLTDEEFRHSIIQKTKHALAVSEEFTQLIVKRMEQTGSISFLTGENFLTSPETSQPKKGRKRKSAAPQSASKNAKKRKGNGGGTHIDTYINAQNLRVSTRQPSLLEGTVMREYQLDGLQWLLALDCNGANGILADEMGLGKTLQVIALLSFLIEQGVGEEGPFLVIGPLSTLHNWVAEFKKFAPKIPVILYHGNQDERAALRGEILKLKAVACAKTYPVIVTNYNVPMRDQYLSKINWRYLIVDEAHRLKNHKCLLIRKLRAFCSTNRLLLTGTPLQNNMTELWSLLNFILPTIVTDMDVFECWFDSSFLQASDASEKIVQAEEKDQVITTLHKILKPFLLRRVKSDVGLNLPPKKEIVVFADMTEWQRRLYSAVVDKTLDSLQGRQPASEDPVAIEKAIRLSRRSFQEEGQVAESIAHQTSSSKQKSTRRSIVQKGDYKLLSRGVPVDAFRNEPQYIQNDSAGDEISSDKLLEGLAGPDEEFVTEMKIGHPVPVLRQICNHPYLASYPCLPGTKMLKIDENIVQRSGKMQVLNAMLIRLKKNGHKVLIFSNFTKMLDIIEDYLIFKKFQYTRLDGTRSITDREENIQQFNANEDIFVFLISTRAGGLGINLVAADTVIIFDSDWNPQADLQAQDRCHRIGQTRPVAVYRFVVRNTIDQRILDCAEKKKQLDKLIIQHGKFKNVKKNETVSLDELRDLLETKSTNVVALDTGLVYTDEELDSLCDRSAVFAGVKQDTAVSEGSEEIDYCIDELSDIDDEVESVDSADACSSSSGNGTGNINFDSQAFKSTCGSESGFSEANSDSRCSSTK